MDRSPSLGSLAPTVAAEMARGLGMVGIGIDSPSRIAEFAAKRGKTIEEIFN